MLKRGGKVFLKEEVREYLRIGEAVPVPTRRTVTAAGIGPRDMYQVTGCSTLRSEDSLIPEDQIETVLDVAIELYVVAQRRCLEEYKKNILEGNKGG